MPTKEELHTFLRTRRSIRRFKPDPVPESVIESILTHCHICPLRAQPPALEICRRNRHIVKTRLGESHHIQNAGGHASRRRRTNLTSKNVSPYPCAAWMRLLVVIVLCRDKNDVRADTPEEATMGIQSTALAGLQLLLAAHAEGLGGNWICWPLYAQEATRTALELPETWEPQAIYFLGLSC